MIPAISCLMVLAAASVPARVLTLDEAISTARRQSPTLRQASAAVGAAAAGADIERAALLPQLSGSAVYQRATANFVPRPGAVPSRISPTTVSSSFTTFNFVNFGVSLSQLVWDFQSYDRWRAAQSSSRATEEDARATLVTTLYDVRTAYFQARAAKALLAVAAETLANQQRHLEQVQGFVEVGTRPEIDLAQARTDYANAQVSLVNAENGYDTARARLNQTMGVEGPTDYDVTDESLAPVANEQGGTEALFAEALGRRPEVAAITARRRAQELTLRATQGGYAPSLSVSTGFADAGQDVDDLAWNWNAGVSLAWPIFQGGLTRAQVQQAEATLAGVDAQIDALRSQIRLEVEQARLAVRAAGGALGAAGEALVNARERLRLAEGRYQTGVGGIIELGDAQLALTSAAAQRVRAEYDLASARAQLVQALGLDNG